MIPYPLSQMVWLPTIASPLALAAKRKSHYVAIATSLYVFAISLLVSLRVYKLGAVTEEIAWGERLGPYVLVADSLSTPIAVTIALLCFAVVVYSVKYMHGENLNAYYALYLLFETGMLGSVLAYNLALFFLFFELMLVPSWVLVGVWGTGDRVRIAYRYFMYTELGAIITLIGIAATYALTGTLDMRSLPKLVPSAMATTLLALTSVGLLVKMAVVPLHAWLPDTHAEAPTPISALLSPAMIGIGGYAIARLLYYVYPQAAGDSTAMLALAILALLTMAYGGLMALTQRDIKRLLAYSSISQMGYMLFGVASLSPLGLLGMVVLYISHGLSKAALFMVSGILHHTLGTRDIGEMRGLAPRMPYTAVVTLSAFLGLAGVPPFLGFWGEFLVFAGSVETALRGGIDTVRLAITILAIVLSVLTAAYGLWTIRRVFYGETAGAALKAKGDEWSLLAPAFALVALSVILGIYPSFITSFSSGLAEVVRCVTGLYGR